MFLLSDQLRQIHFSEVYADGGGDAVSFWPLQGLLYKRKEFSAKSHNSTEDIIVTNICVPNNTVINIINSKLWEIQRDIDTTH